MKIPRVYSNMMFLSGKCCRIGNKKKPKKNNDHSSFFRYGTRYCTVFFEHSQTLFNILRNALSIIHVIHDDILHRSIHVMHLGGWDEIRLLEYIHTHTRAVIIARHTVVRIKYHHTMARALECISIGCYCHYTILRIEPKRSHDNPNRPRFASKQPRLSQQHACGLPCAVAYIFDIFLIGHPFSGTIKNQ